MSRSRFIELTNDFCAIANIDQPELMVQGNAIEVDGIDFFVQYDEEFAPDHLIVYCDFGMPPQERLLDAYQALLETNMLIYAANSPAFMLGPDRRVTFGYQCRLNELRAPELMTILLNLAEQARDWRTDHFLDA
ncbi:CesT family type III secretion system chaperone [Herbaspirillum sp. SJZ099]|uniref:CesT family type III secretion system chaperone n=1 Tax=Herbaspirillum sp. SJZ099 TaxID=2572916 RepID=UPI0011A383CA|nr:CesT family type III secretion system chaperone [Herbaspirillum sp. SJZ099]TWC67344.1 Tir chaperone family protein CesT [Herbaspirillum sp. SJZ099]